MTKALLSAAFILMTAGCPDASDGPPAVCTQLHARCVLKPGVLGVCDMAPCTAGQEEPCLVCRSQH